MKKTYLDCISVSNMRESDNLTIEKYVPSPTLMYRAAMGVYKTVNWHGDIKIAVGGGNNGGDGYALACILSENGYKCIIIKLSDKMTEDSSCFAKKAMELSVPVTKYSENIFKDTDIIVDCLLGTGFQGSLRSPILDAVNEINNMSSYVVSVDINSGMNGDTGDALNAVKSDLTVTIGYLKHGLISENAKKYIKRIKTADIGIVLSKKESIIYDPAAENVSSGSFAIKAPDNIDFDIIDVSGIVLPYNF